MSQRIVTSHANIWGANGTFQANIWPVFGTEKTNISSDSTGLNEIPRPDAKMQPPVRFRSAMFVLS